jgi:hypothetical protein
VSGVPATVFGRATTYNTQLVFIRNGIESERSSVVIATTQAAPVAVPPQIAFTHVAGTNTIDLSWNPVTASGDVSYFVEY